MQSAECRIQNADLTTLKSAFCALHSFGELTDFERRGGSEAELLDRFLHLRQVAHDHDVGPIGCQVLPSDALDISGGDRADARGQAWQLVERQAESGQ